MRTAIVLIILLGLTTIAVAQTASQILSANLYRQFSEGQQIAFVLGAVDAYGMAATYPELARRIDTCLERLGDVTGAQFRAIVNRFVEQHPETWHLGMAGTVALAILEICPR